MTAKEAIETIALYIGSYHGARRNGKSRICEALNTIADAAEKVEKYRWHSLRKNPEDLPEEWAEIAITWVNHDPASYYSNIKDKPFPGFAIYAKGSFWWWSTVCEDYLREYGRSPGDEMDKAIEVIAWCEIEPFDGAQSNEYRCNEGKREFKISFNEF